MRRFILFLIPVSVAFPLMSFAAFFEHDLFYGVKGPEVSQLQNLLTSQGLYSGPVNGNFYSLTREAVKKFQEREKITPASGYVGQKTRTRINALSSAAPIGSVPAGTDISAIVLRLKELQAQLEAIQKAPAAAPVLPAETLETASSTATTSISEPAPVSPSPQFNVGGGATLLFPSIVMNPFKLGDFTLSNDTPSDLLISQIVIKITENINSPNNRGRDVFLTIRDGSTISDETISRTKFTINSNPPQLGEVQRNQISLSFPIGMKAGGKKTIGVWIENLDLVLGGTMNIDFDSLLATSPVSPVGGFRFALGPQ